MTQPEKIDYLIGFATATGGIGSASFTFTLPVTAEDVPMIRGLLTDAGHVDPIVIAVSRLAPRHGPAAIAEVTAKPPANEETVQRLVNELLAARTDVDRERLDLKIRRLSDRHGEPGLAARVNRAARLARGL